MSASTRREFLAKTPLFAAKLSAFYVFADGFFAACARAPERPAVPPLHNFKPEEAVTLDAILACMIPSDVPEGTPGAREANVITYVDRELSKPELSLVAKIVKRGVLALEAASKRDTQREFAALDTSAQVELLTRFQANQLDVGKVDTGRAFSDLQLLAFEGFLGDPSHGGNQGSIAWKSLGFDPNNPWTHVHAHDPEPPK